MCKKNQNSEVIAYEKIKRAIMLKRLFPGQQLGEEWISKHLKMSRTPVRAALKKLQDERLVEVIPRRGAFVYEPSIKEIQDVFNVRIVLESYAAKISAPLIQNNDIKRLNSLLKQEENAYQERKLENFIEVNNAIHVFPAIITKNEVLISQINTLIDWSNCYVMLRDPFYNRSVDTAKNIPEHKAIVEALSNKQSKKAEEAVRYHLQSTADSLENPINIFDED